MTRKSWQLDRRTFLRGTGVAAALPWLEAMGFRGASRREPIRRMCFVYFPNGASMPEEHDEKWGRWRWFPHAAGSDYEFTDVLSCLEPFRSKLSLLGGLSHPLSRELLGHLAGDTWLTAGDMRGDVYKNRVSVDQVAALELKKHTRYPSLVLSTDGGVGYKSRVSTLSFDHSAHPIPAEHRQRLIFERYFAPGGGASTEARRQSLQRGKKIVDLVLDDAKRLRGRLGAADRTKLDEFLDSVGAVEEQIRRDERWLDVPRRPVDASALALDAQADVDPTRYLRTMFDLMVLGWQTDSTRVITFMLAREDGMGFGDNFPRHAIGVHKGHHTISHDTHDGHFAEWGALDAWYAEQFAYLLGRLRATSDEHGPLLDGTALLYGSCCSTTHNARNYPLVLAGGSRLGIRHGVYRRYDDSVPLANLFVSLLNAAGAPTERFADGSGALPDLFA
jgi:hypothetical protein